MTFVEETVHVTVPATSANLGPGFDCLGLALSLRDELTARVVDGPASITVSASATSDSLKAFVALSIASATSAEISTRRSWTSRSSCWNTSRMELPLVSRAARSGLRPATLAVGGERAVTPS